MILTGIQKFDKHAKLVKPMLMSLTGPACYGKSIISAHMAYHQATHHKISVFDLNLGNVWSQLIDFPRSVNIYRPNTFTSINSFKRNIERNKPDIMYIDGFNIGTLLHENSFYSVLDLRFAMQELAKIAFDYNILLIITYKVNNIKHSDLIPIKEYSANTWYINQVDNNTVYIDKFFVKQLSARYWNPFPFTIEREELITKNGCYKG